jgi:nucleotide-binding universal stress UspA family protein
MSGFGARSARLHPWSRGVAQAMVDAMTVLAAYDPQTLDGAPVRFAVAAARFADAPLVIVSVRAGVTPAARTADDALDEELERLRTDLTDDCGVEVRTRSVETSTHVGVARGLQRVIDDEHAGLVVVGSSNRGVVGQVVPGTTAQRVISGCARPVVVVPHGYDPPQRLSTIGVAFTPTLEGRRALREAAAVARMTEADLRVLTVLKPGIGADASAGPAKDAAARNHAQVEATLDDAIAELADGVRAESDMLVDDPADALVSVSPHLDLLVTGSRAYGPGRAVLVGSVSRRVTMKARCPVLVVRRGSTSALAPWTQRTAAGVPARDIQVLAAQPIHDVRHERVGGFAGPVSPNAPVGTYAGAVRLRRQGAGAFAGDPDEQRQGSFDDTDAIISYEGGAGRSPEQAGVSACS